MKQVTFNGCHKIHKSENLQNAIKEQNKELISVSEPKALKLKPIVGRPKCPINSRLATQLIFEATSFILSNNSVTFEEMFYLRR